MVRTVSLFVLEGSTLQVSLLTDGQDWSMQHDLEICYCPWTGQ